MDAMLNQNAVDGYGDTPATDGKTTGKARCRKKALPSAVALAPKSKLRSSIRSRKDSQAGHPAKHPLLEDVETPNLRFKNGVHAQGVWVRRPPSFE